MFSYNPHTDKIFELKGTLKIVRNNEEYFSGKFRLLNIDLQSIPIENFKRLFSSDSSLKFIDDYEFEVKNRSHLAFVINESMNTNKINKQQYILENLEIFILKFNKLSREFKWKLAIQATNCGNDIKK